MADESVKLIDQSGDRKYYTITPRLVEALSRSPYDYTLWGIIKGIAGESGECYLATSTLATLAMMSIGKVQDCRRYLIEIGLLEGEVRRDPGYPQPVWHIRVPDIWGWNLRWVEEYPSIEDRVRWKESIHQVNAEERSPHEKGHTPGEKGDTPGEKGHTPGETKNNHKNNQKEQPHDGRSAAEHLPGVRSYSKAEQVGKSKGQPPGEETKTCPKHGVPMKRRSRGQDVWYSHQLPAGGWCSWQPEDLAPPEEMVRKIIVTDTGIGDRVEWITMAERDRLLRESGQAVPND